MKATPQPPAASARAPERWALQARDEATATLLIPADHRRERRFEIACAITVAVPEAAGGPAPWLQMTVLADGAQQWQRRLPAQNPGEFDGLDVRFSRSVPVGRPLRVTVSVAGQGVRRRTLHIEADEIV
jgi:hypothetical protein